MRDFGLACREGKCRNAARCRLRGVMPLSLSDMNELVSMLAGSGSSSSSRSSVASTFTGGFSAVLLPPEEFARQPPFVDDGTFVVQVDGATVRQNLSMPTERPGGGSQSFAGKRKRRRRGAASSLVGDVVFGPLRPGERGASGRLGAVFLVRVFAALGLQQEGGVMQVENGNAGKEVLRCELHWGIYHCRRQAKESADEEADDEADDEDADEDRDEDWDSDEDGEENEEKEEECKGK